MIIYYLFGNHKERKRNERIRRGEKRDGMEINGVQDK
jgi:hypothetical protein